MGVLFDELFQFLDMPLNRLLTWGDNGLEAKRVAPAICPGVGFSDRELSDGPAEKVKPCLSLMWVECVGNLGFARFQFQPHISEPCCDEVFCLLNGGEVLIEHHKVVCVTYDGWDHFLRFLARPSGEVLHYKGF